MNRICSDSSTENRWKEEKKNTEHKTRYKLAYSRNRKPVCSLIFFFVITRRAHRHRHRTYYTRPPHSKSAPRPRPYSQLNIVQNINQSERFRFRAKLWIYLLNSSIFDKQHMKHKAREISGSSNDATTQYFLSSVHILCISHSSSHRMVFVIRPKHWTLNMKKTKRAINFAK